MNQDYRRLADRLGLKTQASLRDAQRRWLQYRDADQLLIDAVYERTKGTMFAPMQAYSHLRLVRERSLILKSYFTVLTNPKARKDLPRAGKEKEDPENSGSSEVDYPADDFLDHCIDRHATPSEQASCVEAGSQHLVFKLARNLHAPAGPRGWRLWSLVSQKEAIRIEARLPELNAAENFTAESRAPNFAFSGGPINRLIKAGVSFCNS